MPIAVYWDIKGTLLLPPAERADLFLSSVQALGHRPVTPVHPRDDLTDRRAGELYLEAAGLPLERIDDLLRELDRQSATHYLDHPWRVMPGAREALAEVAVRGWRQSLVSGNTPSRIRTKLFTSGIDPSTFDMATSASGAFVSDRSELGRQIRERSGEDLLLVVGDRPADLLVADVADARFLAVTDDPVVRERVAPRALAVVEALQDPAFCLALDDLAQEMTPNE